MYDIIIYKSDGRQGPTIRGLSYTQMHALVSGLGHYNIKPLVKTVPLRKKKAVGRPSLIGKSRPTNTK